MSRGKNKMKAMISCYGNTRSSVLAAAVKTHLDRMGVKDIEVNTGGLEKMVEAQKGLDMPLPKEYADLANKVDPEYGRRVEEARKRVATPEELASSSVVLVADGNLANVMGKISPSAKYQTMLQYVGLQHWKFGHDLDDVSPHGALDGIRAKFVPEFKLSENPEENDKLIKEALEKGVFRYHAPLGGSYMAGSPEALAVQIQQLYTLGRLVAQKLVEDKHREKG